MNNFFERYRIEPRCEYVLKSRSWLVVYDKKQETYVKETGSKTKYRRFKNSDEINQWYEKEIVNVGI